MNRTPPASLAPALMATQHLIVTTPLVVFVIDVRLRVNRERVKAEQGYSSNEQLVRDLLWTAGATSINLGTADADEQGPITILVVTAPQRCAQAVKDALKAVASPLGILRQVLRLPLVLDPEPPSGEHA